MKPIFLLYIFLSGCIIASAQIQDPPFWNEIAAFKKSDSASFPGKNSILFVGSSSFRMWQDVQNDFPGYRIINRGFGGSSLPDLIRYENDIIFPYAPKQVVIYCGENDLAGSDSLSVQTLFQRFVQLFLDIRRQLPGTSIAFVSIKPSPSRAHLMPKMVIANKMIEAFLRNQKKTAFIDVYSKMLTPEGTPMTDLFVEDRLHMNRKGYEIWKREIAKALEQ